MITVRMFVDPDGKYRGFRADGHAGYAEAGEDIVCAAVSALTQNTVNAIETFTDDPVSYSVDEGFLEFSFLGEAGPDSQLLMNALALGLKSVEECSGAGNRFLRILTEEV